MNFKSCEACGFNTDNELFRPTSIVSGAVPGHGVHA